MHWIAKEKDKFLPLWLEKEHEFNFDYENGARTRIWKQQNSQSVKRK
jgi:hypothetical protein